jgi:hypothetical protein
MYSFNVQTTPNYLEYYPSRDNGVLREATRYLMAHMTNEERLKTYSQARVHPSCSVLFRPVADTEETDCVFTKYMRQFLQQHPDKQEAYLCLYNRNLTGRMTEFFTMIGAVPRMLMLQNAKEDLVQELDKLWDQRTHVACGTVTYYLNPDLVEENDKLNINDQTVYVGTTETLYVNTLLDTSEQLMELLNELYCEKRLVIVTGGFNHDIADEEYKYIEEIPMRHCTSSRAWSGFQSQYELIDTCVRLKTETAFVLMNDAGTRFLSGFEVTLDTCLLDGNPFSGFHRIPNSKHPALNAMIQIKYRAKGVR